jgi:predicted acyl esterase
MPEAVSLTVDRNLPVQMRDGTTLYADVYRPASPGPHPALLTRTPYDKALRGPAPFVVRAATAGYAVVIQDVRGRFTSEGPFETFVNERQDGYDTLEWLVSQSWCDGNIGMFGGSYVGLTQWQAALSGHEALKAIVPTVTASNYHNGWAYQGGAFELQFNLSWTLSVLAVNTVIRKTGLYSDTHESLLTAVPPAARRPPQPEDLRALLPRLAPAPQLRRVLGGARRLQGLRAADRAGAQHRRLARRLPGRHDREFQRHAHQRRQRRGTPEPAAARSLEPRRHGDRQPHWQHQLRHALDRRLYRRRGLAAALVRPLAARRGRRGGL